MAFKFERNLFEVIDNAVKYIGTRPLNLGGYAASGGGGGGPPGGTFGQLPQTDVAYDLSELASLTTPASGSSLLDNLNHIRYRIENIESGETTGLSIFDDGVLVLSGVRNIDFLNHFDVVEESPTGVTVALLSSGIMSDATYSGVFGEDLTSQINGTHFDIVGTAHADSLEVYLNGVRQRKTSYTMDGNNSGFTTDFTPISGDSLFVDYVIASSGSFHTHYQYALADDVYTKEEVLQLLLTFSRDVNQQIIFTLAGSGVLVSGLDPIRVYAHDVNAGATIQKVLVGFNTPPSTEVRINVLKNGITIFDAPSYVTVASGAYTGSRSTGFFDNTFVEDDYFQMKVEKGDSVGKDMTVHIRFSYELE